MDTILNISLGQIFGGATGVVVLMSVLIEIVPIKINPVSSFLSWIGKHVNKELMSKIGTIKKDITDIQKTIDQMQTEGEERNAVNCRIRIVQFADEVAHGQRHSSESFYQVLSDIDEYEHYCEEHPKFLNNKTVVAKKRIIEDYEWCLAENKFL